MKKLIPPLVFLLVGFTITTILLQGARINALEQDLQRVHSRVRYFEDKDQDMQELINRINDQLRSTHDQE